MSTSAGPSAGSIEARLARAGLPPLPRLAWIEVDQHALAHNLRQIGALVGRNVVLAPVVKADGYGHGIEVAARAFLAGGAHRLCVATLDEAVALRTAGVTDVPIIVLFALAPDLVTTAVEADLELVAADEASVADTLAVWRSSGRGQAGTLRLHLEVETGLA
ncbi:MAG: alanine racemase, partial [Chloroflexi bacterium]|nr:alanine racemase [Chloroflexota bacterium]